MFQDKKPDLSAYQQSLCDLSLLAWNLEHYVTFLSFFPTLPVMNLTFMCDFLMVLNCFGLPHLSMDMFCCSEVNFLLLTAFWNPTGLWGPAEISPLWEKSWENWNWKWVWPPLGCSRTWVYHLSVIYCLFLFIMFSFLVQGFWGQGQHQLSLGSMISRVAQNRCSINTV